MGKGSTAAAYRFDRRLEKAASFKTNPNFEHRKVAATYHSGAALSTYLAQDGEGSMKLISSRHT